MTEVEGIVSDVGHGMLVVEVHPQSGCGRCREPGGCGGGLLTAGDRVRNYRVANTIGAVVGDRVLLALDDGKLLRGAMTAYGVPGGLLLAGAACGSAIWGGDAAAVSGAMTGLMLGIAVLYSLKNRLQRDVMPGLRHSDRHFDCEGKS